MRKKNEHLGRVKLLPEDMDRLMEKRSKQMEANR